MKVRTEVDFKLALSRISSADLYVCWKIVFDVTSLNPASINHSSTCSILGIRASSISSVSGKKHVFRVVTNIVYGTTTVNNYSVRLQNTMTFSYDFEGRALNFFIYSLATDGTDV